MSETIESTAVLRRLLRDDLSELGRLDPLPRDREQTQTLRHRLLALYGSVCAYCDRKGPVQAAHVVPLEVGGPTTESNLVLLCGGCHSRYDLGHLSISNMMKIAADWRRFRSSSSRGSLRTQNEPEASITAPPKDIQNDLQRIVKLRRESKLGLASKMARSCLKKPRLSVDGRTYLTIKLAELNRRRSAKEVLQRARKLLEDIPPDTVPAKYQSVFLYELGYVYRLSGEHANAEAIFRQSAASILSASATKSVGVDYVAAKVNETLAGLAKVDMLSSRRARALEKELQNLMSIAGALGAYWGGRWALNCAVHIVQVHLKAQDGKRSWKALEHVHTLYRASDVGTGWELGSRQTLSQIEGLVRVLHPREENDVRLGTDYLARSFVNRLGGKQRPEGIRDVGFGLAVGLRATQKPRLADSLEGLMQYTVDGTSVLWPWRGPLRLSEKMRMEPNPAYEAGRIC